MSVAIQSKQDQKHTLRRFVRNLKYIENLAFSFFAADFGWLGGSHASCFEAKEQRAGNDKPKDKETNGLGNDAQGSLMFEQW
jgi:hypothetical protein